MATRKDANEEIIIQPVKTETVSVAIIGTRPLILHKLSEKARQELLFPKGRKTTADRANGLKHNPVAEFRASAHTIRDPEAPTLLGFPASGFKRSCMTAALDMPGAKKTQVGRLLRVEGDLVPIYGWPEMFLAVTRSSDIARTPDVRTRAIVPEWAAVLLVSYAVPILNRHSVTNLLAAAGMICGVGDWRTEKGSGTYGSFELVNEDDPRFQTILANGGRTAQQAAMLNPHPYDEESAELASWFADEVVARGKSAYLADDTEEEELAG